MSGAGGSTGGKEVDERILAAFLSLKQENSSYELKQIDGGFYVYLSSTRRDEAGNAHKVSIYKGKITKEGAFVPVRRKKAAAPEAAEVNEGAVRTPDMRPDSQKYEKTILTVLSMNGRISLPVLARMLGLSVNATAWQVKSLERKYGIRYLPEIDVSKFGYMKFLVTVTFLKEVPPASTLKAIISSEPRTQIAMLAKGEADLLIFLLAKTTEEAISTVVAMRDKLSGYGSVWSTMPLYDDYGFVLIRNEFIDLLKSNGALLEREYAVLRELNTDGSIEFSKIDKKYGFDAGRASYSYYKLRNEGKIKRATLTMQKTPVKYLGVILKTLIHLSKFIEHRQDSLSDIIEEETPTNKYLAVYDTAAPAGSILFMPVYGQDDLDKEVEKIQTLDLGVKLTTLVVSNTLVGNYGYRHFDNAYSVQQEILEKEYGTPKAEKINYEETGRNKAEKKIPLDIRGTRTPAEEVDLSRILP